MNFLQLSDIHGNCRNFATIKKPLEKANLVLLSGDITHFGSYNEAKTVIESLRVYNKNIFAVSGNCDYPGVTDYLKERNMLIEGSSLSVNGYTIYGIGGSLPCPFATPNEHSEEDYSLAADKMSKHFVTMKNLMVLAHQPPNRTRTDRLRDGNHVGSKSLRRMIEQCQPLIYLCGHIHDSYNTDKLGKTCIVNPGAWRDGRYAIISLKKSKVSVSLKKNESRFWKRQIKSAS